MSRKIVIYKRTRFGRLAKLCEYSATRYELVISAQGVLTIREAGCKGAVLALSNVEWSKAVEV